MLKINFILLAALLGGLAVMLGAFSAHGLEKYVDLQALQSFRTGVDYQFYHVFALLFVGLFYHLKPSKRLYFSGLLFMVGIILFSGSLYAYALTGIKLLGAITPLGGLALIIGWGILASAAFKLNFSE
jgi:uncharacterized membrane protein YgdD (TMEM256/DUF423 family)